MGGNDRDSSFQPEKSGLGFQPEKRGLGFQPEKSGLGFQPENHGSVLGQHLISG